MIYLNTSTSPISRISNYPHNKQAIRSAGTVSIETTSHMFDSFADTYSRRYIIASSSMERTERRRTREIFADAREIFSTCVHALRRIRRRGGVKETARKNMNHEPLTHLGIRRAAPVYIHFVRPFPSLREHVRNNFEEPQQRLSRRAKHAKRGSKGRKTAPSAEVKKAWY